MTEASIEKVEENIAGFKAHIAAEEEAIAKLINAPYSFVSTAYGTVIAGRKLEEKQAITNIIEGITKNIKKICDQTLNLRQYKSNRDALKKAIEEEKAKKKDAPVVSASLDGLFEDDL